MMSVLVAAPVEPDHAEMILEDLMQTRHEPGGPELRSDPGRRRLLRVCHWLRRVGTVGRHSPLARRHPVHDPREERGRGWHVVREHVSGARASTSRTTTTRTRSSRKPGRTTTPSSPRFSTTCKASWPAMTSAARALLVHGAVRVVERADRNVDRRIRRRRRRGDDDRGERGDLRGRSTQPAVDSRTPRRDELRGPVVHSARWDSSVDLAGKNVALIGAGAGGFQIAPPSRRP